MENAKQVEYLTRYFYVHRITIPLFSHIHSNNLCKYANSVEWMCEYKSSLFLFQLVWRQWEFAFFGALAHAGALFICVKN